MTTIIVASNPGGGSNTGIARTLNQVATVGNTLIAWLHHTAASTNTMTGCDDNVPNAFTQDYTGIDSNYTEGVRVYRRTNIGNAATSFTPKATVSTGVYGAMLEVSGMDNSAPWVSTTFATDKATTHAVAFTTTTPNAIVMVGIRSQVDLGTISGLGTGWVNAGLTRQGAKLFYNSDLGAAGAKTLVFTSTYDGGAAGANYYFTEYKAAVTDPTVSTVTGTTVTEGGNIVFTVTLSGATNRDTGYSYSWGGTATGADYTQTLTTAMCARTGGASGNVTVSGSNITAETGVSAFSITVPTTQDALDEDNETIVLTIGGVASTGASITDNDAPPVVTFTDGVESFGVVTCVATLGAVSGKDVSFQVDTTNGTKTAGTNYTAIVAQTVTIPAGSLTAAITANTL